MLKLSMISTVINVLTRHNDYTAPVVSLKKERWTRATPDRHCCPIEITYFGLVNHFDKLPYWLLAVYMNHR